jgi:uncharacterized membrane protein YhaH (DUF805 family)
LTLADRQSLRLLDAIIGLAVPLPTGAVSARSWHDRDVSAR